MNNALTVLHELGDATRLRVLTAIVRGRKNVSAIVTELGLSQPQVSYHLRRLKEAGLAVEEKDGRWVWYEANHDAPESHLRELIEYVERWAPEGEPAADAGDPTATAADATAHPDAAGARRKARSTDDRPVVKRPAKTDGEMEDFLL